MSRQRKGSKRRERIRRRHARTVRRVVMKRRNRQHHVSRKLAGGTVVVEDPKTANMTRSAKGTVEHPGTNVKAKSGLNRGILATG